MSGMICPLIPMGALTGRPTKQQLTTWLDEYRRVGIKQFMIYARSGLEIEYLSADWFEACQNIIEHAAATGMVIWIYDEFNWPSGGAAGKVLANNPDFAARKLLVYRDVVIASPTEPIAGGRAHCRILQSTDSHAHDVLNPDAMDCFIRLTHEQYAKHFSAYFGNTIKGFFTDEPSFAYGNTGHCDQQPALKLPWYPELEQEYRQLTGRDFRTDLADHLDGQPPENMWSTYSTLLGVRFRFAFTERISRWCEEHGLISTGHFANEFSPSTAISYSGDPMTIARSLTMPGIDEIFSHATIEETEWLTLKTVEQASLWRRTGAMAELFALGPCDLSMSRRRQIIWLAALHGVDHYVTAVSSIDARANAVKKEYYHPFTPDQPWFESVRELGEEAALAAEWASKSAVYSVAVRFPQTLVSEQSTVGNTAAERTLMDLLRALVATQWSALLVAESDTNLDVHHAVLALHSEGIVEEKSGAIFFEITAVLNWLEMRIQRPAEVLDMDGKLAGELLIKSFADGSVAILSFSTLDREGLVLKTNAEAFLFDLPSCGVFTFPMHSGVIPEDSGSSYHGTRDCLESISVIKLPPELEVPAAFPTAGLHYNLDRANTLRLTFDNNGESKFEILDELRGLCLVARLHTSPVRLELDGRGIEIVNPCRCLPGGFRPLYAESAPLTLSRGKHTVRLVMPAEDFAYLPVAFVVGPFARCGDRRIGRLPATLNLADCFGAELRGYVGKINFHTELDCSEATSVRVRGLYQASELLVGGRTLGRRLWAPFVWPLPDACRRPGLAVTLCLATSIGSMFGEPPIAFRRHYSSNHWFNPLSFWPTT